MQFFAIGSYTSQQGHVPDARGKGLSLISLEESENPISIKEISVCEGLENPAYLTYGPKRKLLYAASEEGSGPGRIDVFSLDDNQRPVNLSVCPGNNHDACHISLSQDESRLYTASYGAGQTSEFKLDSLGYPQPGESISYRGSGPDKARQESPHAHQIVPSPYSDHIYVCDLGTDTIWMHRNEGNLPGTALKLPEGYGPRHLAFHKNEPVAYILCELVPRIVIARIDRQNGSLHMIQEISSIGGEIGPSSPVAPAAIKIHPSGKTVAVSNRFRDTIAIFEIGGDNDSAVLTFANEYPCGGKTPRDIEFNGDGSILLIANQDSHRINSLLFDPIYGKCMGNAGPALETGSPSCILKL